MTTTGTYNKEFYRMILASKCLQEYNSKLGINNRLFHYFSKHFTTKETLDLVDFIWFRESNDKLNWSNIEKICFKVLDIKCPNMFNSPLEIGNRLHFNLLDDVFKEWYKIGFIPYLEELLPLYYNKDLSEDIINSYKSITV